MAATHEYKCVIRLQVPIHHQNVSIVNFMWGQKVVPAGWLPAADRLELRHTSEWLVPSKIHMTNCMFQ